MSTVIYYFSGTGNCLSVAKGLTKTIQGECYLIQMAEIMEVTEINPDIDKIGFVFPVYFADIPRVVSEFAEKIVFKHTPYLFAVITCNGVPGITMLSTERLFEKKGIKLQYEAVIHMPGNAVSTSPKEVRERLAEEGSAVREIGKAVNCKEIRKENVRNKRFERIKSLMIKSVGRKWVVNVKNFKVSDKCINCGMCEKICPVHNIKITEQKPEWGSSCVRCLACFHWCSQEAVTIGGPYTNRTRYHHPQIGYKDIVI